ncbi:HD-GYP domain-containing protein [Alteribacillus sp. HJP-4]|uniref:HD-GYP domain-containing protein n=1 Tax=Alteribacillus sp. HJP-4 TaxID=2775394 RepID=UPI0035CCE1D5
MRYALSKNIQQGDKLAKSIYATDGRILLKSGVPLTVGLISRLHHMGVHAVYLENETVTDIHIEEVVSDKTKKAAVAALAESFRYVQNGGDLEVKSINQSIRAILEEVMLNQNILLNLTDIRTNDSELYHHSVDVCIMAVLTGAKLGLDQTKLHELGVGALLHDVGKILPKTEQEENDHHTWRGFEFLRRNKEISTLSAHIALAHHEFLDGSGKPRGLNAKEIHLLSKITAVVNYYDNLISGKAAGSEALQPYQACEHIMALSNRRLAHQVVWIFLRTVAFYPTGAQVQLTTGDSGIIIRQHTGLPQRPVVRVFRSFKSPGEYDMVDVDLAEKRTTFIKEILE